MHDYSPFIAKPLPDRQPIELLAPARDLACGIAAINHGADAVYIGAPKFSARAAAGNSIEDIEQLVRYAHRFYAKVYVALNTILTDREIVEARTLIWQLYQEGIDALIIQDLGLLECDLPPVPLHASTQMDNRTAEKVRFLEQVGFRQVVLARELHLNEIRAIRAATTVPLEFFIHGALCVSYSGRCFISEVMNGRSANRGECAQFCRYQYNLYDGQGRCISRDRSLLSLKDLEHSADLTSLLAAGISSLKIEGRLKDEHYVKNITAFYRQKLDTIFSEDTRFCPASSGRCRFGFTPDPAKSFQRDKTDYFLNNRRNKPGSIDTVKSTGKSVGRVVSSKRQQITVDSTETFANGDGLCFYDTASRLVGIRVNRAEGRTLHLHAPIDIAPGTTLYRNHDAEFSKQVKQSGLCRSIHCHTEIYETATGIGCTLVDEDGCISTTEIAFSFEATRTSSAGKELVERQMKKTGGTLFHFDTVIVQLKNDLFIPASSINGLRRKIIATHLAKREQSHQREEAYITHTAIPWLSRQITYEEAVTNSYAESFYRRHGVEHFSSLKEACKQGKVRVMVCRYCLRNQLDLCPKSNGKGNVQAEQLFLEDKTGRYELHFDCSRCEMSVYANLKGER